MTRTVKADQIKSFGNKIYMQKSSITGEYDTWSNERINADDDVFVKEKNEKT